MCKNHRQRRNRIPFCNPAQAQTNSVHLATSASACREGRNTAIARKKKKKKKRKEICELTENTILKMGRVYIKGPTLYPDTCGIGSGIKPFQDNPPSGFDVFAPLLKLMVSCQSCSVTQLTDRCALGIHDRSRARDILRKPPLKELVPSVRSSCFWNAVFRIVEA